jgi:glycosyltransferase involved in cell wall biosynthesis
MKAKDLVVVKVLRKNVNTTDSQEIRRHPFDWFDVQSSAVFLSGKSPVLFSWNLFLVKNVIFFSFAPSLIFLLACLLKKKTVYLCWGFPEQTSSFVSTFAKDILFKFSLKNSNIVLVNDLDTFRELKLLGVNTAKVFPYIVDTNFFQFAPYNLREDFLLVPGDNGRNEELVYAISLLVPFKFVRVTRSEDVVGFYKQKKSHDNIKVCLKVSPSDLRDLYQRAKLVILPITAQNHAAGQTSVLEAVACGATVLLSKGRTSSIFKNSYESVFEIEDESVESWISIIKKFISMPIEDKILRQSFKKVKGFHDVGVVTRKLVNILENM